MDSSLVADDECFWQKVPEKYHEDSNVFETLAWDDTSFEGIYPYPSKLNDIYKRLTKSYGQVLDNHKEIGNHSDHQCF